MTPIKLFFLETLIDGTKRLQSQMPFIYRWKTADFILKNGKLYIWGYNNGAATWIETEIPYVIVTDIKQMEVQAL